MYEEPAVKRAVAFVDGANTRLCARKAHGDQVMNINPLAMIQGVCAREGWQLAGAYYYLGVPDVRVTEDGYYAWMKRCARWRRQGLRVFTRTLLQDANGISREKGIDVRLALDAVDLYRREPFDVAVLFSQDQDFSELAAELKTLAREQGRWIEIVSAFPWSDKLPATQGIVGTRAITLDEPFLRSALDSAQNRNLRFDIAPPRVHEPRAIPQAQPAFLAPQNEPAVLPSYAQTLPVPVRISTPSAKLRLGFIPAAASTLYLAASIGTFALLSAQSVQGWVHRTPTPEASLNQLTQNVAQASLWPLYWTRHDELSRLTSNAAREAAAMELHFWPFEKK